MKSVWHFLPELMLTGKVISGKTCRSYTVARSTRFPFLMRPLWCATFF